MSEFTKGQWEVHQKGRTLCVTSAYGDKLIIAGGAIYDEDDEDLPPETAKANARLIAAAPEMYEFLKIMLSIHEKGNEGDCVITAIRKLIDRIDGYNV